jgi:diguanylate cyclase (GGDEF)-like protein/PAS domain S-box-containing protein
MIPINEVLPSVPVGLFQAGRDGRVSAANPAFCALVLGGTGSIMDSPPWANAHPGDRAAAELSWLRATESNRDVMLEFRVWHAAGKLVWVRLDAAPIVDPMGRALGYAGSALDITEAVTQRILLDRLLGVMAASGDAVIVLDRTGAPVYTNEAARSLFDIHDSVDLIRDPSARGLMQIIRDQVPREVMQASDTSTWSGEVGFRGSDGLERTLDIDIIMNRSTDGIIEYWGGVARDITVTKQVQTELTRQANHDPLTGLPNRLLLLRTAADALERTRGSRGHVAMLFLDVDKLKDVNDTVGHDIGDALLAQVASRLSHATRPTDVVARIGGDEFVVLCNGSIDEHSALDLAERVRLALSGKVMVNGVEVDLTVSVGVALSSADQFDGSNHDAAVGLLRNADIAMYVAKRRGRSRCELYTEAMRKASRDHKQLSNELERALAADELHLAYQPILSTHSGRVTGAEALLRWNHPERGVLMPAQFVHLAEESGAIVPIGDWVIRQACNDTRAWIDAGLVDRTFSVHINVAARQLAEGSFVEKVLANMRQMELNPQQVTLDFDEATLNDNASNLRSLQALRRFGVQLALDGFGTGPSSLTALRTCEADVLKLDGTVARTLGTTGDDDPIVRSIIQLAHALDMQVVAEWITSADQLQRLRVLGCDLVQGFLLGEPSPAEQFGNLTRR